MKYLIYIDNKLLRHELGFNPELPAILHGDVAGIVTAVGPGVRMFEIGDEIYGCVGGFIGTPGALAKYVTGFPLPSCKTRPHVFCEWS